MTSLIGFNAFRVKPRRYGMFASDRVELGSLVLDVGGRWDHYNANALFPRTPGFIFNNPRATLYPNAATDPAQYAAFLADTGIWTPSRGHHALSPRLRAGYALSSRTSVRIGYGQQAELPSLVARRLAVSQESRRPVRLPHPALRKSPPGIGDAICQRVDQGGRRAWDRRGRLRRVAPGGRAGRLDFVLLPAPPGGRSKGARHDPRAARGGRPERAE